MSEKGFTPMRDQQEAGKSYARIVNTLPSVGKTRDVLVCACGARVIAYRWSWAGHGKKKCSGCNGWIKYTTLEVYHEES